MTVELTDALDSLRQSLLGIAQRRERAKIGQFLTPAKIARFMASLFEQETDHVRILDPGAGTGVLFAACVDSIIARRKRPSSVQVVAYETDEGVLPHLRQTMECCESACTAAGINFCWDIRADDFVETVLHETEHCLFAGQRFTHAILNPPYMKIEGCSATHKLLKDAGIVVPNLYAAFVSLAARVLAPGGEMVAITPRSFCNGLYFRPFRVSILEMASLRRIHVFESRSKAFGDDDVLQENVIYHMVRAASKPRNVELSSSEDIDFSKMKSRLVPYERVVLPGDRDAFIHLLLNDKDDSVMGKMRGFVTSLAELGLEVSTGRVVDFRATQFLRFAAEQGAVPLIHPFNFKGGFVIWPGALTKKPVAIANTAATRDLTVPAGYYVLTKRFSSKEEPRRVVAAVYDPTRIRAPFVGFENHLNYFHPNGRDLSSALAKGLTLYLSSSLFDQYFRLFSGHTQVNATDLRKMPYPSLGQLLRLGGRVEDRMPEQKTIDSILEKEVGTYVQESRYGEGRTKDPGSPEDT